MKSKNNFTIPTIIGVVVLVLGITVGVFLISSRQIFRLGATSNKPPQNVRISNVTDTSFTVTWTTPNEATSLLLVGSNPNSLSKIEEDEIKPAYFTHSVTVQGLLPLKTHYFVIESEGDKHDNNGAPWQVNTGSQIPPSPQTEIISGSVLTSTGTPAKNVIVNLQIGGAAPVSTITSNSGSWIIPTSSIRTTDLNSIFTIDSENDIIEISAQAGPEGVSSAQIYLKSAKPVPPMILGQVHDFKNLPPSSTEDVPDSDSELPDDYFKQSRFDTGDDTNATPSSSVTLDSLDEDETITSETPSFFGEGPPGTTVSIIIESDPIEGTIIISSSGDWEWTPPEDLEAGTHQISLSWTDKDGILQTLTRSFTAQAAEAGPAYEATPSAAPDATPSFTPAPTIPSVSSPSATIPPQPESGIPLPTLMLIFLGFGLLSISGVLAYFAFSERY